MALVGGVESLWRYPVKSKGGEELSEVFASSAGIYSDRLFVFKARGISLPDRTRAEADVARPREIPSPRQGHDSGGVNAGSTVMGLGDFAGGDAPILETARQRIALAEKI